MSDTQQLIQKLVAFRDARDWAQFHNPKDLAAAISIEAGELLELFLWKGAEEVAPEKVAQELADVLAFAFLLADRCALDIGQILEEKMALNEQKYPVEKARGSARKYNEL